MFFPLYITACLSAIAQVSSRPGNPAANIIAEVKREAETLDHSGRLMDEEAGLQESRQADGWDGLLNPLGYDCYMESDCWRDCDPREDDHCEVHPLDSRISKKCFLYMRDGCSRTEDCVVDVADKRLCRHAMTYGEISRIALNSNSDSEVLASGAHRGTGGLNPGGRYA